MIPLDEGSLSREYFKTIKTELFIQPPSHFQTEAETRQKATRKRWVSLSLWESHTRHMKQPVIWVRFVGRTRTIADKLEHYWVYSRLIDTKERPKLWGGQEWFFEEQECPLAPTHMLLVRIVIGKIEDRNRFVEILRNAPIREEIEMCRLGKLQHKSWPFKYLRNVSDALVP